MGGWTATRQRSSTWGLQQAPPQSIWLAGDVTEWGETRAPEQGLDAALSASTLTAESSPDTAEEQPGQVSPRPAGHDGAGVALWHGSQCSKCTAAVSAGPPGQPSLCNDPAEMQKDRAPRYQGTSLNCFSAACSKLRLPEAAAPGFDCPLGGHAQPLQQDSSAAGQRAHVAQPAVAEAQRCRSVRMTSCSAGTLISTSAAGSRTPLPACAAALRIG